MSRTRVKSRVHVGFSVACLAAVISASPRVRATPAVQLTRVYDLRPGEGVFAYARVSPDGERLAYASEGVGRDTLRPDPIIRVVDLRSGKLLYTEAGIDAYWSPTGDRLIYESHAARARPTVAIWNRSNGSVVRDVARAEWGDYNSWGSRRGRDVILTITNNYYELRSSRAAAAPRKVPSCPGYGAGDRPLLSKDATRITTFVRGMVVVRDLDDCRNIMDTQLEGGKADFSWDGRLIAFHSPRPDGAGYEIKIVDLMRRTVRTLTLPDASGLYPSWTQDGRLCFRYDGHDYRGFVIASNLMSLPEVPLPKAVANGLRSDRTWHELLPGVPGPRREWAVLMIWNAWSAHVPRALVDLQAADSAFEAVRLPVETVAAEDPFSSGDENRSLLAQVGISLPELKLTFAAFNKTEARNQIPSLFLFRNGALVDRHLGALSRSEIIAWVDSASRSPSTSGGRSGYSGQ